MGLFDWLGGRRRWRGPAETAYTAVVEAARNPVWYSDLGVADTTEGRFDMLALHASLTLRRMTLAGPDGAALGAVFMETMVRDLDANLREMGISDMGVPRRVRQMVEAFYGRAGAYRAALEAGDAADLAAAVGRNVFRSREGSRARAEAVAAEALRLEKDLRAIPDAAILRGEVAFAAPEGTPQGPDSGPERPGGADRKAQS